MCEYDPQEDDFRINIMIKQADMEAARNLKSYPKQLGFCHRHWEEKKRILQEKYGIRWKSPADMNPDIFYD